MGSKSGTNTVQTQSQPPAQFLQAYTNLLGQGNQVASQPLQQYSGPMVAGFTGDQANAFSQVEDASGVAMPYYNSAASYAAQGAAPSQIQQFSQGAVDQYQNPYTQDVINSTMANINQQNQLQQQGLLSQGIRSGNAFGGDRAGLAQAALTNQQNLASGQTIAGLESAGYGQSLGELNTQQQTQLAQQSNDAARAAQASYQFGNIGQGIQGSALTGANALLNTGQQQQALAQQQLNVPYGQFTQQQAYPFQTTNFLAGLTSGLGSQAGGSSSTTGPGASQLGQMLGLGQLGLGAYNAFGSGAGAASGLGAGTLGAVSGASGASELGALGFLGMARGGSIPHYDVGGQTGLPGDPMSMGVPLAGITKGIPNIGALSYLQPINVHGSGPPKAPNIPHVDQNQQLASNVKAAQNLVSGIGKDVNQQQPSTATNYVDATLNQTNPQPILPQPDDTGYARGGGIPHYAMGGAMQGLGLANAFGNLTGNRTGPMNTAMGNASISNMLTPHMADGGGLVGYLPSATGIPTPQINPNAFNFNPNITGSSGGVGNTPQMPPWAQGLGGGNMMPGMQGGGNQMPPWQGGQQGPQMGQGQQNGFLPPWLTQGASQGQQMPSNGSPPPQGGTFANNASASSMPQGPSSLYVGPPTQQYGQPTPNMQPQKIGSGYDSIYALPQIPLSSMPNPNTVYTTGSIPPPGMAAGASSGLGSSGSGGGQAGLLNNFGLGAPTGPQAPMDFTGLAGAKKGGSTPHFDEAGAVIPDGASPALDPSLPVPEGANVESAKRLAPGQNFSGADAFNYLVNNKGQTPVQAAALAGNIQQESGFNPNAYNKNEGAYGLVQWRGDRLTGLKDFASSTGRSPNDPYAQLDYIDHEMGNTEAKSAKGFLQANNLPQANASLKNYIRYGDDSDSTRLANANQALKTYGSQPSAYANSDAGLGATPGQQAIGAATQPHTGMFDFSGFDQSKPMPGFNKPQQVADNGLGAQKPVGDEDLDPHPTIDHSGETSKITYPSTGEELDTGLPGKSAWQKLLSGQPFMSKQAGLALMQSGLATMAAASRPGATALGAIGQGGQSGLQQYMEQSTQADNQKSVEQALIQQGVDPQQAHAMSVSKEYLGYLQHLQTSKQDAAKPIQIQTQQGSMTVFPQKGADGKTQYYPLNPDGKTISTTPIAPKAPLAPGQEEPVDPAQTAYSTMETRSAAAPASKEARSDEYLASLAKTNPRYAADIKAVANYEMAPSTFSLRNNTRVGAMGDVKLYDPTYDQTQFANKQLAVNRFGSGVNGNQVRAFNVSLEHLALTKDLLNGLQNGDTQLINRATNAIKTQLGYGGPPSADSAKLILGDEIAKAVIGGTNGEADRKALQAQLTTASSPEQIAAIANTFERLLSGQLVGLKQQYETSTGLHNFDRFLTPRSKESFARTANTYGEQQAAPQTAQPQINIGEVRKGYSYKGGDPSKPESWQKVSP